jgi:predicted transcriptional regulator
MFTNFSFGTAFGRIFHTGFKYRDRTSIIGEILDTINSDPRGKTKTSIMRSANLNLDQVNKYLQHLQILGLIVSVDPFEAQEIARYRLTARGLMLARDAAIWRQSLHKKIV